MDIHTVTFDLTGKSIETESDGSWRDDFLRALGYLVVQSNYLEDAVKDLYWIVTKRKWPQVHEDLRKLTLGLLVEKVVEAFEKRFPTGEFKERLDRFKPELERAVDVRNQYVHASWAFDHAKAEMEHRRLPRQAGAVEELRRVKVSDMEAASEMIGDVAERVASELYDPVQEVTKDHPGEILQIKRL